MPAAPVHRLLFTLAFLLPSALSALEVSQTKDEVTVSCAAPPTCGRPTNGKSPAPLACRARLFRARTAVTEALTPLGCHEPAYTMCCGPPNTSGGAMWVASCGLLHAWRQGVQTAVVWSIQLTCMQPMVQWHMLDSIFRQICPSPKPPACASTAHGWWRWATSQTPPLQ